MGPNAVRAMGSDRMLEQTSKDLRDFFAPGGAVDALRLMSLPTLVLPELQDPQPATARVGHIENLTLVGNEWRYRFIPNAAVSAIPTDRIDDGRHELLIDRYEGNRTHWAVKPVDLYRLLPSLGATPHIAPTVFQLPTDTPRDPDLIAVMMPFEPAFDPVYQTMRLAATDVGMTCLRADDIWKRQHIMDDILDLIWRARIVVADFTGKNANVLYEVGISHTIGRELVPITQSIDDVPFDLRPIRAQPYLNNKEGRGVLRSALAKRLQTLLNADT